jgi:quinohemoprotein ethanol dehydrogenase
MILADVPIEGHVRRVLMQAPKNGFFYVLDRITGELIAAKPFAYVNWAKGIDPATDRPLINDALDYTRAPAFIAPGMAGAHNWPPMSFSARTGLVYLPALEMPMVYVDNRTRRAGLQEGWFTTMAVPIEGYDPAALTLSAPLPTFAEIPRDPAAPTKTRAVLRAWDPVAQRVVWERDTWGGWAGGVMSTASNLIFQGDLTGALNVYAADSGASLTRIELGTSITAAPMTYALDGEQYVAVMAGFGGGGSGVFPEGSAAQRYGNAGRLIVLKLGGGAAPLPEPFIETPFPRPPARIGTTDDITRGEVLYARYCGRCHEFGRGLIPDLRRSSEATHAIFYDIVLKGTYVGKGMGRFDDVLSGDDATAVHAFVIDRAWAAYESQKSS